MKVRSKTSSIFENTPSVLKDRQQLLGSWWLRCGMVLVCPALLPALLLH
jgi:hypothetical protein